MLGRAPEEVLPGFPAAMAVDATVFSPDTGFLALTLAALPALFFRRTAQAAAKEIAWPVVVLGCGIITYIAQLQKLGVVDALGTTIAAIGAPLLAALRRRRCFRLHPRQVEPVHHAWQPTEAERDGARRVVAAPGDSDGAAVRVDGRMIDRPDLAPARALPAG
ncbi:hypothetical protein ACIRO3_36755 [Streptomyces sp. NPDC102278]|uniref:hypothetical protein n=1 Tax=Streptomyces sp. NPDC102278 TaxID=3366152 RepID=UPI003819731F